MALVVDASVGLKWALREADSRRALALLASDERLLVPDFWLNEATNVLWVQVLRKMWTAEEARAGLALLSNAVKPTDTAGMGLHPTALEIGLAIGHSPYDCLYVAFALAMGADRVVVADAGFQEAIARHPDPSVSKLLMPLRDWGGRGGLQ